MRVVIVSGSSGSGKSAALNHLEDLGFYCVDNLPLSLLSSLTQLFFEKPARTHSGLAICIDIRTSEAGVIDTRTDLETLRQRLDFTLIFFDATEQALTKRFNETRRRHPLASEGRSLAEAIALERVLLEPLIASADLMIDTSQMSPSQQRDAIAKRMGVPHGEMSINVQSFGFKKGAPSDADIVLDMRMLANPHWEPDLRAFTGQAPAVKAFIESDPDTESVVSETINFLQRWIPLYRKNQRAYLTIAIGCTGGKHRSVYVAGRIHEALTSRFDDVSLSHRDIPVD